MRPDTDEPRGQPTAVPAAHPRDRAAACWCDLESWTAPGGEILVGRVSGELDLATHRSVAATLVGAARRAPRHLVVDLAAMTFCGVRGYDLLAEIAAIAGGRGIGFALSGLTPHQCRVVNLIMPQPGPVRHRSVAAAVTTIRADHAHRSPHP